jgi:hypothetical protein
MNKNIAILVVLLFVGAVVMVSGCTSNDSSDTISTSDGDPRATADYDPGTGVTSGITKDGYGYAYDDKGHYAVSDGENTVGYDENTGEYYEM